MTQEEIKTVLLHNADRLRAMGARSLYIFGSRARGDNRPDSDLDLFMDYEPDQVKSYLDFLTFQLDMKERLGIEVQLAGRNDLLEKVRKNAESESIKVF